MIIAHIKIEHSVASMASHRFDELIGRGQKTGVSDRDGIKGLQVVDKMERSILLFDTELVRAIRSVRVFVDSSSKLIFKDLDDVA